MVPEKSKNRKLFSEKKYFAKNKNDLAVFDVEESRFHRLHWNDVISAFVVTHLKDDSEIENSNFKTIYISLKIKMNRNRY